MPYGCLFGLRSDQISRQCYFMCHMQFSYAWLPVLYKWHCLHCLWSGLLLLWSNRSWCLCSMYCQMSGLHYFHLLQCLRYGLFFVCNYLHCMLIALCDLLHNGHYLLVLLSPVLLQWSQLCSLLNSGQLSQLSKHY